MKPSIIKGVSIDMIESTLQCITEREQISSSAVTVSAIEGKEEWSSHVVPKLSTRDSSSQIVNILSRMLSSTA